jgi:hypothetical protein
MPLPVHPRLHLRGAAERAASEAGMVRVLVYAPAPARAGWVEAELQHEQVMIQIAFSIDHVVSALVEDPPPRPQILVADFDELNPGEILHLHLLRDQGWFGRIIALGSLPPSLRTSLAIECVIDAPLVSDALRTAITSNGFAAQTTKLPVL